MSAASPSVTALLPAYNAAAFIDETLQSLAAQTYPNFRVLISVDASTDDTAERCERFARGDARFTVVRQVQRLGWIRNSSELLHRAESDLCFFMGHDDVLETEFVASLAAALAAHPPAALAYCDLDVSWPDGRREVRQYRDIEGLADPRARARAVVSRAANWWTTYKGLFRVQAARRGGGRPLRRNLAGEFAADWPFLLHFALEGEFIRVPAPRPLYRKRLQSTSLSISWRAGVLGYLAANLCCAGVVMRADFTPSERMTLLAKLAWRAALDVFWGTLSLPRRALRRAYVLMRATG